MAMAVTSAVADDAAETGARSRERVCRPDGPVALEHAARRLADRVGEVPLAFGLADPEVTSLAALADPKDPTLLGWLSRESRFQRGMDRKAEGAFLIGRLTSALIEPLAYLFLAERIVPDADARSIGLSFAEDGDGGVRGVLHIDQCVAYLDREHEPGDLRDRLRLLVIGLLGPIVDRLRAETGLSIGAYWRLIADILAYKFLAVGTRLGSDGLARSEALALIRAAGSPLKNGKTGFVEIAQPETDPTAAPATKWFITRGGCCRYYTCEGGEICSVCVLREPEDRDARLRAHLVRLQGAAS